MKNDKRHLVLAGIKLVTAILRLANTLLGMFYNYTAGYVTYVAVKI